MDCNREGAGKSRRKRTVRANKLFDILDRLAAMTHLSDLSYLELLPKVVP